MNFKKLMVIEHGLQINRGQHPETLLRPSFSIPAKDWEDCIEEVQLVRPDGASFKAIAKFSIAHFNISDPASTLDDRWRVVVVLKDTESAKVPEGTELFAMPAIWEKLAVKG